jgi:hypothetical protein
LRAAAARLEQSLLDEDSRNVCLRHRRAASRLLTRFLVMKGSRADMNFAVRAPLFVSLAMVSCVIGSDDELVTSSVDQYGQSSQSYTSQGQSSQGQSSQGQSSQSTLLTGVEYVTTASVKKNGLALSGVKVEKGQLIATGYTGDALETATMTGTRGNGASVQLQIVDHKTDVGTNMLASSYSATERSNTDVHLYKVNYKATDGSWQLLCNKRFNPDGSETPDSAYAVILPGYWEISTGDYYPSLTKFTIGCWQGTIAKCVRWGYKPWKSLVPAGATTAISLKDVHLSCVRGAMADYCGNGTSYTKNGTIVDVFDRYGFIKKEAEWNTFPKNFSEESSFDVTGAGCVEKARWEEIGADCPTEYEWIPPDYSGDPGGYYKPIKRAIPTFRSGERSTCMGASQLVIFDTSTYCKDPFTATEAMPADCSACTTDICAAHPECCADFYDSDVDGDAKGVWTATCRTAATTTLTCGAPIVFSPISGGSL